MSYKERDLMYSQLQFDGFQTFALQLTNMVSPSTACGPSNRLMKLLKLGLTVEDEDTDAPITITGETIAPGTGIDLDVESESSTMAPEAAFYETCYVTAHKAACRVAAFNSTGQLVATGSEDASIKILDVERMLAKSVSPSDPMAQETMQQQMETHPVIRTLYDHSAEVTAIDFHPEESYQVLVSGSRDCHIKLFDFSNPSVKKAQKTLLESHPVKTLNFHPSGNYLLVGTEHPTLRLYDVNTCQCFVSSVPEDQHTAHINMVRWSPNANYFVTAGADGLVKLWSGVSCRAILTLDKKHEGQVHSAIFSRNSKESLPILESTPLDSKSWLPPTLNFRNRLQNRF